MIGRLVLPFCLLVLATASAPGFAQAPAVGARHAPTVDELIALKSVGGTAISPDGRYVAYTVRSCDWQRDSFVTHVHLADAETGRTYQLTQGPASCAGPTWSPDGKWLAFFSTRAEGKGQIFAIRPDGGEAVQLTKAENGVNSFAWSRDGKQIAYTATDVDKPRKDRDGYLDPYQVIRDDYSHTHLYTFAVADALDAPVEGKRRTSGKAFTVTSFSWSPDGTRVAFGATRDPDFVTRETADVYVLTLADDSVKKIVDQPGPDDNPEWSPDGRQIVFGSLMGRTPTYARNVRLCVVSAEGGTPRCVSEAFDENPILLGWERDGVYFQGARKTAAHLFRLDPATGKVARVSGPDDLMAGAFSLSRDARRFAFTAGSPTSVPEVFVTDAGAFAPKRLTDYNNQTANLVLGTREVVSWKSKDGATIEGVLIKPADFDPAKKYPLLCVIHGGPTGIDRPVLLSGDTYAYPADVWAARGALILKVNYRVSAGYGEAFRLLNVRNLGVGDAWDVLSGVDYLVGKGWADPKRVACMGWSQGGYISAFLTTSSDRFAAVSVGAGISNWATYYYNTDITPFTINHLGANPTDDPEIYRKTSPMSYIKGAKTPTLIQHGENDRRVPIANAYELRQGLEDRGVPVRMIVYNGFGHGVTKPKAIRALQLHNLAWFNHYLWGDPAPNFAAPEIPKPK